MNNNNLEIKIAETIKEIREVVKIRHEVFGKEGYLQKKKYPYNIEFDSFDLLHNTKIFIAKLDDKVIGTVRLIEDSKYGLPLEKEVDFSSVRKTIENDLNKKLAEGSRIVILPKYRNKYISMALLKIGIIYAIKNNLTDIISIVDPGKGRKNKAFNVAKKIFIEKIGYKRIGQEFYCENFNGYAIPLHLETKKISQEFKKYLKEKTAFIQQPYSSLDDF